jgi:hypothetical protein
VRATADRGRALLVLLLALVTVAGAAAPATAQGYAAQGRAYSLGGLAPDTPATHHDLRDWLRLPVASRQALSTPAPDSWWAVCTHPTATPAPRGHPLAGQVTGNAVAVGVAATPSTRAPPVRVN